ncbi:MAG: hypothetical protein IPF98_22465 [Gemmatimonadetes bacterium]|nr:hypothetical protein [Gemmatimonadota bacterium]
MSLQLRLKKGRDGRVASFALHRADGSVTVMRNINPFFPMHDLTHYAVESTLRLRQGFYGMVSDGWNFDDFGAPWPRGAMPADRDPAEEMVGLLDWERATGFPMTVDDVNEQLRAFAVANPTAPPLVVTQSVLDAVRERVRGYHAQWKALPNGQTLVLEYAPGEDRQP